MQVPLPTEPGVLDILASHRSPLQVHPGPTLLDFGDQMGTDAAGKSQSQKGQPAGLGE
jgi:hypothetical protein